MIIEFLAQVNLFLGIHILRNKAVSHASNVNLGHQWWLFLWCKKAAVKYFLKRFAVLVDTMPLDAWGVW
jgi:hypothetical protein